MMGVRMKVRLWTVNVCRFLLVAVMMPSGFVKLADPMGMVYKLQAYLTHWSISIDDLWLKVGTVALGVVELQLGVYLLLGIRRRTTVWMTLLMMLGFTALSIYLYLDGGIADCGCFGAAAELAPDVTLVKNIFLVLIAGYVTLYPRRMRRLVTERNQGLATIYVFTYSIVLSLYSLHYLPLVTFTDYRVGENWARQYQIGEEPARAGVMNLALYDKNGDDVAGRFLNDSTTVFVVTLPNVVKADDSSTDRINDLYDFAIDHRYEFIGLVSDPANYGDWSDRTGASYEVYNVDEDFLKAMVRSNPGMLLLHKGVLLGKWGTNDIPETSDVAQLIELNSREIRSDFGERMVWIRLLLLLGAPLLLLIALDGLWLGRKYRGHKIRMRELLQQKSNVG